MPSLVDLDLCPRPLAKLETLPLSLIFSDFVSIVCSLHSFPFDCCSLYVAFLTCSTLVLREPCTLVFGFGCDYTHGVGELAMQVEVPFG